jgi:Na+/H+ antiporter NhaB
VGNLFTSPGLLAFLGGGRPESAALRGSLVGLASGVEAVTEEDTTGKTTVKRQPLSAALTIFVYVVGGIIAALIFRRIRQAARIAAS